MLMDFTILCFHFRKLHPPISSKIIAVFLIRNTLAITLTDLLKKDLTFKGRLMRVLLHFLLLLSLVVLAVAVAVVGVVVIVVVAVVVVLVTVILTVLVTAAVVKS